VKYVPYFVTAVDTPNDIDIDSRPWLRTTLAETMAQQQQAPKNNNSVPVTAKASKRRAFSWRSGSADKKAQKHRDEELLLPKTKADFSHWQIHKHKYLITASVLLGLAIATVATIFALTGGSLFGASIDFLHGGLLAQNFEWWATGLIAGGTAIGGLLSGFMLVYGSRFAISGNCCDTWEDDLKIEQQLDADVAGMRERRQLARTVTQLPQQAHHQIRSFARSPDSGDAPSSSSRRCERK
jgi:hypothetical protein